MTASVSMHTGEGNDSKFTVRVNNISRLHYEYETTMLYKFTFCVHIFIPESLEQLPPVLLRAADTLGDRLVKKVTQLIHNKTINLKKLNVNPL